MRFFMNLVNRHVKIFNANEFEGSPKYITVQKGSPIAYLHNKLFFLKYEEVCIFHVEIVSNRTANLDNDGTGVLTGAVLAGLLGAILASITEPIKWDVDAIIWLKDGRDVKVTVRDETMIKLLHPYMNTSTWELEEYNKNRHLKYQVEYDDATRELEAATKELDRIKNEQAILNKQIESREQEKKWRKSIDYGFLQETKNYVNDLLKVGDRIDEFYEKNNIEIDFPIREMILPEGRQFRSWRSRVLMILFFFLFVKELDL